MDIENFKNSKYVDYEIDFFMEKLLKKTHFSYSRFNDGELFCVIKYIMKNEITSQNNCDGHSYFPEMGLELINSLNNSNCQNYFIQFLENWISIDKIQKYTNILIEKKYLNGTYQYSDFLQKTLRHNPEKFKKFIEILNQNDIMIVGPHYLKNINFLKFKTFIEVPIKNCYVNKHTILDNIKKNLNKNTVILFSSSMATNVFIDDLYKNNYLNISTIDAGSLWDIFFYKTNPEIKQRTPNLGRVETFKEYYKDFFYYG